MSRFMRDTAKPLPATMPIIATMIVMGCRSAKTMGFIRRVPFCLVVSPMHQPAAPARAKPRPSLALRTHVIVSLTAPAPQCFKRLIAVFDDFADEFPQFPPRLGQDLAALGGGPVI